MTFKKLLTMAAAIMMAGSMWAQTDVTSTYLTNADLSTVDNGWTYYSAAFKYTDWKTDGDVPVVEFYSQWNSGSPVSITQKDFKFSQSVTLPAGYYRLAVNAFYRNGAGDGTNDNKAWIFVKGTDIDKSQNVAALTSAGVGSYTGSNDLYKAANAFSKGDFSNAFDFTIETESAVEIGFQGFFNTSLSWCILGPVKIYKYSLTEYFADYYTQLNGLVDKVDTYESRLPASVFNALKAQVSSYDRDDYSTIDEITTAIATLQTIYSETDALITKAESLGIAMTSVSSMLATPMNADVLTSVKAVIAKYQDTDPYTLTPDALDAAIAEVTPIVDAATASIAVYNEIAAWNAKATNLNAAGQAAYADILEAYNNGTATESASAKTAYEAQIKAYNFAENADVTALITNPNFDSNTNGWTSTTGAQNRGTATNQTGAFTGRFWENWNPSAYIGKMYQVIEGLPNGVYTLTLCAFVNTLGEAGTQYVYGNDKKTNLTTGEPTKYTVEGINVTDGKLEIGFEQTVATANWAGIDNATLTFIEKLDLSTYETAFAEALAAAKAIDQTASMQATVLADLKAAIAEYDGKTYGNGDDYDTAISALTEATSAANASINLYKEIAGYNAKAAALKGTAAAEAYAAVLNAYNEGTATDAESAKAAYIAALKVAEPVVDITDLAPASWTGATGTVAASFMKDAAYVGIAERYQGGAFTGDVMTQTITGLQNGTYKVVLHGGASYTSGRGFDGATGQNHAYFFANDALQSLEVYDRTVIADGSVEEAVLICGVTDGTLKYGIQNITIGANWFVVDLESISFESTSLPAIDVTLAVGDAGYATFIAPFEYTVPAGVQAYTVDAVNANGIDLVMTEKTTVPANTPVVLYAESPVSTIVSGVSEAAGMNYTVGLLTGVYGYLEITDGYVLQNQGGEVKFYAVSTENPMTVPANHAYLTVPGSSDVKAFGFDAISTAIAKIEAEKAAKAGIYNLQGQQLNSLQRGINIVNGKKVLVK